MKNQPDPNSTNPAEIEALIARLEQGQLREGDAQLLGRLLRLLLRLIALLQQKNASLARLKRMLFGPGTERRQAPLPQSEPDPAGEANAPSAASSSDAAPDETGQPRAESVGRKAGHGRKAAAAYTGARVVVCPHPVLRTGDHCPDPHCGGQFYGVVPPAIDLQR